MSVKVIKTAQTKKWIERVVENIRRAIPDNDENEIYIEWELLPKTLQDSIMIIKGEIGDKGTGITDSIKIYIKSLLRKIYDLMKLAEDKPQFVNMPILDIYNIWIFKGFVYEIEYRNQIEYTKEDEELLILEDYDTERRKFENLKRKYKSEMIEKESYHRERISEEVRIAVWRRDGAKCARCGSRERLEYDHIVPVSKGGGNTARNIEILCEMCNRKKSNNIQ